MGYNIDQLIEKLKVTKTIFFDLDGTLIDTEKLYFRFWKEGASFYGYEMSDEEAPLLADKIAEYIRRAFES